MRQRFILSIIFSALSVAHAAADNADWHIYSSYHNPTKAVKVGNLVYTLASGSLFSFDTSTDPSDGDVKTYDKATCLTDFGINDIAYNSTTKKLVVLYDNCNIDIMDAEGNVWNMSDLKNKALADRTIHELEVHGRNAYVCLGKNLAEIDVKEAYFKNLYTFSTDVDSVMDADSVLYVKSGDFYYRGKKTLNLLDPANWTVTAAGEMEEWGVAFTAENVNDTTSLKKAESYVPNSPSTNDAYKLRMVGGRLLMAGGKVSDANQIICTPTAHAYENGKWTTFDQLDMFANAPHWLYKAMTDVIQDPSDPTHHFASAFGSGLMEFKNFKIVNCYTYGNSGLQSAAPASTYATSYVRLSGLQYDKNGNLWMLNNEVDSVIRVLCKDGTWKALYNVNLEKKPTMDNIMFDSKGYGWINNRRETNESGLAGMFVFKTDGTPANSPSENNCKYFTSFVNQNGKEYSPALWYCMKEDLDGDIWFGNSSGLFALPASKSAFASDFYLHQVVVNRDDGSGYADYLLDGVYVRSIAIDGANRKWIGTLGNGVYLISADGQEMLQHFTTGNSPLLSDDVTDIAINGTTGEIFFATDNGLCSYTDALTESAMELNTSNIVVYPNPLRPEMTRKITVSGLSDGCDVKISNASGRVVRQGISTGGQFVWNCRTDDDKVVMPGMYYVLATDSEGQKGAWAKFLIVR